MSDDPALVLVDQKQLAEGILHCSERKVERDRLDGTGIPFVRIGRLVRYRLVDVLEYLERRRQTSTSDTPPEEARPHEETALVANSPRCRLRHLPKISISKSKEKHNVYTK